MASDWKSLASWKQNTRFTSTFLTEIFILNFYDSSNIDFTVQGVTLFSLSIFLYSVAIQGWNWMNGLSNFKSNSFDSITKYRQVPSIQYILFIKAIKIEKIGQQVLSGLSGNFLTKITNVAPPKLDKKVTNLLWIAHYSKWYCKNECASHPRITVDDDVMMMMMMIMNCKSES